MPPKESFIKQRRPLPVADSNQTVTVDGGEQRKNPDAAVTGKETRIEQAEARTEHAEARTEQAEARTEQAKTRAELAETRTEQAETRTELAKTRTEQAEFRTEQAEATLERVVHKEDDLRQELSTPHLEGLPVDRTAGRKSPLEELTGRHREILQFIAEGRNTKQIAEVLKVSAKTVEYHRMKLMDRLNIHDVPGLVRFALRAGLVSKEG